MKKAIENLIKPEVQSVQAYSLHKSTARIKLDQNENSLGFPEELKAEFWEKIKARDWARYPEYDSSQLRQALAERYEMDSGQILVANGSNSLIQAILMVTVARGNAVVIPQPTFSLYELTVKILSGTPIELMLNRDDFSLPVERVLEQARLHNAKIIILCSPNNPTGNAYPQKQIETILNEFSGIVIVDEAYAEFADQDLRCLLKDHDNLILLRTFSKAFAMAGCRVGYLLAHGRMVHEVSKSYLPYCVSLFAETAALVSLAHRELLNKQIEVIVAERDSLVSQLGELKNLKVYPTQANFVMVEFKRSANTIFENLLAEGILVRDVSHHPMLENCLRISVGTSEENQKLVQALREMCR